MRSVKDASIEAVSFDKKYQGGAQLVAANVWTAPDICIAHAQLISGNGCATISELCVSPCEIPLKPTTMRNEILEAFRLFCK